MKFFTRRPFQTFAILSAAFSLAACAENSAESPPSPSAALSTMEVGSADAEKEITIYTGFWCPTCRIFFQKQYAELREEYVDTGRARVRLVQVAPDNHNFVISNFVGYCVPADQYAEARDAVDPAKLMEFIASIDFDAQGFGEAKAVDTAMMEAIAPILTLYVDPMLSRTGVAPADFQACLSSPEAFSLMEADKLAQDGMTSSIPGLRIGDETFGMSFKYGDDASTNASMSRADVFLANVFGVEPDAEDIAIIAADDAAKLAAEKARQGEPDGASAFAGLITVPNASGAFDEAEAWTVIPDAEATGFIEQISPVMGRLWIKPETTQVHWAKLPFYDGMALLRVRDKSWEDKNLALYYLTDQGNLFRLNGSSPPIYEAGDKHGMRLTRETAGDYLRFFSLFVHGQDHSPFYILETENPALTPATIGQDVQEALAAKAMPLHFLGMTEEGAFRYRAHVYYQNAMFEAFYNVTPDGRVEMTEDKPIQADLSHSMQFVIDVKG